MALNIFIPNLDPSSKTAKIRIESSLANSQGRANEFLTSTKGRTVDEILTTNFNHLVTELVR